MNLRLRRPQLARALAAIGLAALPLAGASADEAAEPVVEVNGNWLGSGLQNRLTWFPGARTRINREFVQDTGASSIENVMRAIPGVQVAATSSSSGSNMSLNIGVRGLDGRFSPRSTILLDGLPMAVAPYGQPQLSFAPLSINNLESVDVVRGGGAVRYGPQNVGGIINFTTRAIPNLPLAADASLRTNRYDGGGQNTQASMFVGGTTEQGLGLALLYAGQQGSGWRAHSREKLDDLALKFRHDLGPDAELYGKLAYNEAMADVPGGLASADYAHDPMQSKRQHDQWSGRRSSADLGYLHALSATEEVELRVFHTRTSRSSKLANNDDALATSTNVQPRDYRVTGIEPRHTRRWQWGNVLHDITLGYRYIAERSEETSRNIALGSGAVTVARRSENATDAHAFYVDDQIAFGNWRVTPGLRYEHIQIDRTNLLTAYHEQHTTNQALPAVNVAYRVNPAVTVFSNYNTSFGSIQNLQLNLNPLGNVLHPEEAKTIELGARYRDQQVNLQATLFDLRFSNQLQLQGNTGYFANIGKTLHQGLETAAEYAFAQGGAFDGLRAYANLTYTRAVLRAGVNAGKELPNYSRVSDSLGLHYTRGDWTLNLSSTHQSRQFSDEANSVAASVDGSVGPVPAYRVWNVQLARKRLPGGLELALGINNLGNAAYFSRTTDTNRGQLAGAPRMAWMQLRAALR
jgi:Fe(3+) dicitrate transport protein